MAARVVANIKSTKLKQKKITVSVPAALLKEVQTITMSGIRATVIRGLELLAASQDFNELRQLRGKIKFSLKLNELREDR